jgi:Holliday junction resolvasome RuvABC endonuclease subunit
MTILKVAGLDPSLRNFGMVKGDLDLTTGQLVLKEILLAETETDSANKKTVRKNSDDLNRAVKLQRAMKEFLADMDMACIEIPVGSQSARSMASYGICIGIISSIEIPLIQVTPKEVKVAVTNNATASKAQMIEWATKTYPYVDWLTTKRKGENVWVAKNEHLADAAASIHAAAKTDEFARMRAVLNIKT